MHCVGSAFFHFNSASSFCLSKVGNKLDCLSCLLRFFDLCRLQDVTAALNTGGKQQNDSLIFTLLLQRIALGHYPRYPR